MVGVFFSHNRLATFSGAHKFLIAGFFPSISTRSVFSVSVVEEEEEEATLVEGRILPWWVVMNKATRSR